MKNMFSYTTGRDANVGHFVNILCTSVKERQEEKILKSVRYLRHNKNASKMWQ